MKKIFQIFLLCMIATTIAAMEEKRKPEQLIEVPERELSVFESLPDELKKMILEYLVTGQGNTNAERLQNAARNIHNFMTTSSAFTPFLRDVNIHGYLIRQLAQRYTYGNLIEAALALHTAAGGRWLQQNIAKLPAGLAQAAIALHKAAIAGNLSAVSFLINFVPNIVNSVLKENTALMLAAKYGHTAVVERLLGAQGIDVNMYDDEDMTALLFAAQNGHAAIVERLIAAGSNVNAQNAEAMTALIIAARQGYPAIIQQLLAAGSNVNIQTNLGNTALIAAVQHGHVAIIQQLLGAQGINVNVRNRLGLTALGIARHLNPPNKDAIIKLLLEHGAQE